MIKNILLDCGGVLVHLNFREMMLQISGSEQVADYFVRHIWQPGSPWLLYDKGLLTEQQLKTALLEFMPADYHRYIETFLEKWPDALPPMENMEAIVDELKAKGYGCWLLSNFAARFEEVYDRVPVLPKLDGMVVSYRVQLLKPDPAIFQYAIEQFDLDPDCTLFVDDSAANVAAACKLGMRGYVFTTPSAFLEYLQEQNIL